MQKIERLEPLRLLPYAICLTAGLYWIHTAARDLLSKANAARIVATTAVTQTKLQLANLLGSAVPVLQHNLIDGYTNAVGQSLQSFIRPGELSQLDLFDNNCAVIGRASLGKPLNASCRPGTENTGIKWQKDSDDYAVVSISIPMMIDGKRYTLVGFTVFDRSWTATNAALNGLVQNNYLAISPQSSQRLPLLWQDGTNDELQIRVRDWRYLPFGNLTKYSLRATEPDPVWICLLGLFAISASAIFMRALQSERTKREQKIAFEKVRALPGFPQAPSSSWQEFWQNTCAYYNKALDSKIHQNKLLQQKTAQLQTTLRDRDRDIAYLENKLAALAELDSLREQLQRTTASFLTQMNTIRSTCEDLYDLSTQGLAIYTKDLRNFYLTWRQGMQDSNNRERGARKFLRSLAESPGTLNGETMLDSELRRLGDLSSASLDQALHVAMLAKQILGETEMAAQIVSLWHGLAEKERREFEPADWRTAVQKAQALLTTEPPYNLLSLQPLSPTIDADYPVLPMAVLVSGLYHLYLACLVDVPIDLISSAVQLREVLQTTTSTLMIDPGFTAPNSPSKNQHYHMAMANSLLKPFQINVAFHTSGMVSLSWSKHATAIPVDHQSAVLSC